MRAAKIDANQQQVVSALRGAGCMVDSLASVGNGVPDLLVGYRAKNGERKLWIVEVKDGAKPKSRQALTPAQEQWHAAWSGYPVSIVDGPEAALRHLEVLRS